MFDWDKYLCFAKNLSNQPDVSETELRISISRAYYAVFNNCSDKFFEITQEPRPYSDSHKFIIDRYKNGKKEARAIGTHLNTLKNSRIDCDYKSARLITKSITEQAIKTAELISTKLNSITDDHF